MPYNFGVLQGTVFGPILFPLYMENLLHLVKRHGLHPRCYADDIEIYGFSASLKRDSTWQPA